MKSLILVDMAKLRLEQPRTLEVCAQESMDLKRMENRFLIKELDSTALFPTLLFKEYGFELKLSDRVMWDSVFTERSLKMRTSLFLKIVQVF